MSMYQLKVNPRIPVVVVFEITMHAHAWTGWYGISTNAELKCNRSHFQKTRLLRLSVCVIQHRQACSQIWYLHKSFSCTYITIIDYSQSCVVYILCVCLSVSNGQGFCITNKIQHEWRIDLWKRDGEQKSLNSTGHQVCIHASSD